MIISTNISVHIFTCLQIISYTYIPLSPHIRMHTYANLYPISLISFHTNNLYPNFPFAHFCMMIHFHTLIFFHRNKLSHTYALS